jgi:hypothetical protein
MSGGETCNLLKHSASDTVIQCGEETASSKAHMYVRPWDVFKTGLYFEPVSKCDVFKIHVLKANFCCQV